jgi:acetyl-CoA acetyltransferase family protein
VERTTTTTHRTTHRTAHHTTHHTTHPRHRSSGVTSRTIRTVGAYIIDAVRTPIGKIGGALAGVRPDDLAAGVIAALVERHEALDPASIEDVHLGNGNGAGEENRNVARMAGLLAGLPTSVPGATANRLCGSGMEAVLNASREVAVGDAELVVAGGVESMSRAPWVVQKPEQPYERGNQQMFSTTLGWRMVNPRHPDQWTVALGEGAEILADRYGISREEQDEFAVGSHQRAAAAWAEGRFADEVVPAHGSDLTQDECVRANSSTDSLARLRPVFRSDGSVTAGNASPMNDGAAAMLIGTQAAAAAIGAEPLARIVSRAVSGVDPHLYGIGPVEAARVALDRAGIGWTDLAVVELNEAFAAQSLACLADWPELDRSIVNPNGGAIAIGHPIGCSGARIVTTLAHELRRRGGGWGLAAMCIGVGQGIAVVLHAE